MKVSATVLYLFDFLFQAVTLLLMAYEKFYVAEMISVCLCVCVRLCVRVCVRVSVQNPFRSFLTQRCASGNLFK